MTEPNENEVAKAKLLGSLLLFTRVFYKLRTGRDFTIVSPQGREPHSIIICRELTKCFRLKVTREIINIPPGLFKSTHLKYFIAWCFAHYPDCQFLYVSYSHHLAAEHTADIKGIMSLPEYKEIFGIDISRESSAKDNFKTTSGGAVKAFGSEGAIVGQDAGLPITERFTGAVIMDDMHKPDEVHSDPIRNRVIRNYKETILQRPRSPVVPLICIAQRLHEDDLCAHLLNGEDGYTWNAVILKALDECGNSIHPILYPLEKIEISRQKNQYVFASQYQQDPVPAGGALFKSAWFIKTEEDPEIYCTFITADTAETDKTYNDATVFSFWGLYKIKELGHDLNEIGLHWLDCWQLWCEPKDLVSNFTQFYSECMRYKVKPRLAAIEKKSTGTSLLSALSDFRGMQIIDIKRDEIGKSKSQRFIDVQPYIASKLITLPVYGKHTPICIEHMQKITANETHRYDDIADTCADAIKMALIDKSVCAISGIDHKEEELMGLLASQTQRYQQTRTNLWR